MKTVDLNTISIYLNQMVNVSIFIHPLHHQIMLVSKHKCPALHNNNIAAVQHYSLQYLLLCFLQEFFFNNISYLKAFSACSRSQ